ncbi:MAG: hypothetical protein U5R06_17920 [candidate division KSB1 bacterium]|nr:hypothetical protein [candidate division KSB1 bacterium]
MKRNNGDLYYLGYRGTDNAADLWEYVIESDYKDNRGEPMREEGSQR